ncbi:hypothetical protein JXD20_00875 [Candidatus Peregrinibacteria bacterium]|nr:hypothetical protein [Candidatus Peregrinibacteria bacterium]
MSFIKKISLSLFVALLTIIYVPFGTLAAETGAIAISVQDENGDSFIGNWYLHRGTTIHGFLVRNGSGSESFQVDTGSYFLEVRAVPVNHPYYLIHSDNPQYLDSGDTVTFNVQYFETEEEKLIAEGHPPTPQVISANDSEPTEPDVYDVHGCNSTQQYVWCERSESCVRYWTPSCQTEDTEEEVVEEENTTPTVSVIDPLSYREVPDFNMAPTAVNSNVPTFETPPTTFNPEVPEETSLILPLSLAQTGPSAMLALIPSMLIGLAVIRRKH